ncbi:MAG: bifunctional molybdenum cofactor biosynthesis protein MoaC/MoaB [Fimbriimonadaceae bacterium]|nr:bifunctional molybdenum cofactor biosynthesis protein MoaC/MoaB [Fimbriimonadaceae bacterium]
MRDVSFKNTTKRTALARAELTASEETIRRVQNGDTPKGDPIPVAKVAAIQATKKTTEWIPYCHNIPIEHVGVDFEFLADRIAVEVFVVSVAKTGVEMEAMTGAAAAVLTLYDMLKMIDDGMEIVGVRLLSKTGGKSDLPQRRDWNAQVLVMSDRANRGEYEDRSGRTLEQALKGHGAGSVSVKVLPDESELLISEVRAAAERGISLLVITGGTGVGPRDITSDTVTPLLEKNLPGVVAAFQSYSHSRLPTAMLARPLAGIIGETVVLAIPGSPGACEDAMACLMPSLLHVHSMLAGEGHA